MEFFKKTAEFYYDFVKNRLENGEKILDNKNDKQKKNNILLSQNSLLVLGKKLQDNSIQERVENDKGGKNKYALKFTDITGEQTNLIKYFIGWATYFKNFNEIRGNLYKDDGRKEVEENEDVSDKAKIKKANAGQITTRILDENFDIFARNAVWAKKNLAALSLENFQNKEIVHGISIFDHKFYKYCLLQTDINFYNQTVSELNKFLNENKKKDKEIKYFKPLFKQLLLTDKPEGEEDGYVEEFADEEDLIEGLDTFHKHAQEKLSIGRNFLASGKIEGDLDEIVLNENQTHFFCNQFFGAWSYLRDLYYDQNEIPFKKRSKKDAEFEDKEGISKTELALSEIKNLLDTEQKEHFKEKIRNSWFDLLGENGGIKIYQENLGNFENFILFLKFHIDALIKGRNLLSAKEQEVKGKIGGIKRELERAKAEGERVDDLLLSKFSEADFSKDIEEGIEEKERAFKTAFAELKKSVEHKQALSREKDFECKKAINKYCVRISDINRFFSLFVVPEGVSGGAVNSTIQQFKHNNEIVSFFNAIRNFITKRSDEMEKIKLNFDNPSLLGGWAYKTTDYKCRLLRKKCDYYLLIIGVAAHQDGSIKNFLDECEIMNYYQQKGQTIFGSVYKGKFTTEYNTDRENLNNKDFVENIETIIDGLLQDFDKVKDAKEKLNAVKSMIKQEKFSFGIDKDRFGRLFSEHYLNKQELIFSDYKNKKGIPAKENIIIDILRKEFGNDKFDYEEDKNYLCNSIKKIMKENATKTSFLGSDRLVYEVTKLEPYFYKNSFRNINFVGEDQQLNNKKLFLFRIYCKDFSAHRKSDSSKNLHTLYFEELFSQGNQKNPIFKLSGGAEVFFREKIEDYKIEQWERKNLKKPRTDKTPNKKRRFTDNQILFHVPIVLNNINNGWNINKEINQYIQTNSDVKILGIDRGEKELAYYCLLDGAGKICGNLISMNTVGSNIVKDKNGEDKKQAVNYQKKLDIREKERMMARRSWTKQEGIKDLKKGYISNVINNIADLMVKNNAMVCLEELNYGFKKDRSIRIEKGVYQHLENALVDKLNYLVLEKSPQGVRNALQLTPLNRALKYWGNQMGAIFYTDAKFTSKTCPHCGFRRRGVGWFKTSKGVQGKIDNREIKIFFEEGKDRFRIEYRWEYEFQQNNKIVKFSSEDLYGKGVMERIYSDVDRKDWNNYTLKQVFKNYLSRDSVELFALVRNDATNFRYTDFGKIFDSLTWMRHTITENNVEHDRISCPKCHFSTLSSIRPKKIENGDANGVYNIARRGLKIFDTIRNTLSRKANTQKEIESKDLKITLKEWDKLTYEQWDKKGWEESDNIRGL